jgi:hypothetical protein
MNRVLVLVLIVFGLVSGCTSEQDKFVNECVDRSMADLQRLQFHEDNRKLALNCEGDVRTLARQMSWWVLEYNLRNEADNDGPVELRRKIFLCNERGSLYRANERKCQEIADVARNKIRSSCLAEQGEIARRGAGNVQIDKHELRSQCLRSISR